MKASEIMNLVEEYSGETILMNSTYDELGALDPEYNQRVERCVELRAKLQAVADEYADLKHCYSPDKTFKITGKIE